MDFLKSNRRFDFIYNGKNIDECSYTLNVTQNGDTLVSEYLFCDGLKVTNIAKSYPSYGAYEWVNYFENTSDTESGIISNLLDCDCQFEIGKGQYQKHEAYIPTIETATRVFSPMGSTWMRTNSDVMQTYTFPTSVQITYI